MHPQLVLCKLELQHCPLRCWCSAAALGMRLMSVSKQLVAALLPLTTHKRHTVRIAALQAIRGIMHQVGCARGSAADALTWAAAKLAMWGTMAWGRLLPLVWQQACCAWVVHLCPPTLSRTATSAHHDFHESWT